MIIRKRGDCYHLYIKRRSGRDYLLATWWRWNFFELSFCYSDDEEDNRARLIIATGIIYLKIFLPFKTRVKTYDYPCKWGINIYMDILTIYYGCDEKRKQSRSFSWYLPFFSKEWVRTSVLLNNDTWEHEKKGNRKEFYKDEWKSKIKTWHYNYTDKYDGQVVPTFFHIKEMEWRPKWLTWTSLFSSVRRTIEVEFSEEVGRRKGSWKGGTIGANYEMLPGESPLDCIKRMEKDRDF